MTWSYFTLYLITIFMMDNNTSEKLFSEGLVSEASFKRIKLAAAAGIVSVFWEIKLLLYLGVLLLSGGLGILVYKHINTIGHNVILIFLILVTAGCFAYCFRFKKPFSASKVDAPNVFFDYLLLLACLLFLTIIAYLQFQYNFFGNRFGLAGFIPMTVLFLAAYYFDHIGILCMAITNLAAWMGITVTPFEILKENDFNSTAVILTGLVLGVLLILIGLLSNKINFKKHFQFTYTNFGMHILFICCIAAMFQFEQFYFLWFLLQLGIAIYFYIRAKTERSFYFLLVLSLYTYFSLGFVVIRLLALFNWNDLGPVYLGLIYFIGSGIGLVLFLIRSNKKIKNL